MPIKHVKQNTTKISRKIQKHENIWYHNILPISLQAKNRRPPFKIILSPTPQTIAIKVNTVLFWSLVFFKSPKIKIIIEYPNKNYLIFRFWILTFRLRGVTSWMSFDPLVWEKSWNWVHFLHWLRTIVFRILSKTFFMQS